MFGLYDSFKKHDKHTQNAFENLFFIPFSLPTRGLSTSILSHTIKISAFTVSQ